MDESRAVAPDSKVKGAAYWTIKLILYFKQKTDFQHSANFKLLNSITWSPYTLNVKYVAVK